MGIFEKLLLSVGMGFVSVNFFYKGWFGLLGTAGAVFLFSRADITLRHFLQRMFDNVTQAAFHLSVLTLCFYLYSHTYGLGRTPMESFFYFFAVVAGMLHTAPRLRADVDLIFRPRENELEFEFHEDEDEILDEEKKDG